MAKKVKLTAEVWSRLKKLTVVPVPVRGITRKSKHVSSGKKFQVQRAARHIAHRKAKRDGTTQHERVVLGRS